MTGASGSSELINRQRFKGFFRTSSSYGFVGAALAEIARQFRWTQMAIITQRETLFTMVCGKLLGVCDTVLSLFDNLNLFNTQYKQ